MRRSYTLYLAPLPDADAVSVVRFLIEQQGLTQRDLTDGIRVGKCRFDVSGWATEAHARAGSQIKFTTQTSC